MDIFGGGGASKDHLDRVLAPEGAYLGRRDDEACVPDRRSLLSTSRLEDDLGAPYPTTKIAALQRVSSPASAPPRLPGSGPTRLNLGGELLSMLVDFEETVDIAVGDLQQAPPSCAPASAHKSRGKTISRTVAVPTGKLEVLSGGLVAPVLPLSG